MNKLSTICFTPLINVELLERAFDAKQCSLVDHRSPPLRLVDPLAVVGQEPIPLRVQMLFN